MEVFTAPASPPGAASSSWGRSPSPGAPGLHWFSRRPLGQADLAVWQLERGEASFKARNLPNDNLDLAIPIWTTDVHWVPQQPNQLLTSTGFVQFRLRGEVRLYDVAAGRRPQARAVAPLGEEALSAIGCTPAGRYIIAGSVSGGRESSDGKASDGGFAAHGTAIDAPGP